MTRCRSLLGLWLAFMILCLLPGAGQTAQTKQGVKKTNVPAGLSPTAVPELSVDEARMIVKEIPSVDIPGTLARWKLAEEELAQLRQWSGQLVENPSRTDFVHKWSELISRVAARNRQLKEADVTPLIRMMMLAAYEDAQKHLQPGPEAQANLYKELQEQIRANLTQARQLQALANSESGNLLSGSRLRRDPDTKSRLNLPAHQRTLRKCEVLTGSPSKIECKDLLVSTSYELEDYIAASEEQLKKAEEEAKRAGAAEDRQEKRRQILYALSDVAKAMHDSAVAALRKSGR